MTGADLHRFVLALRPSTRSLEEYLRALDALTAPLAGEPTLSLDRFCEILQVAFTTTPPPFDPVATTRSRWQARLHQQILDLREMDAGGQLLDPHRWGGINSPRGSLWYNFEPHGFLECAVAGCFTDGDDPIPAALTWDQLAEFLDSGQMYE
jgi:hypothetical protein